MSVFLAISDAVNAANGKAALRLSVVIRSSYRSAGPEGHLEYAVACCIRRKVALSMWSSPVRPKLGRCRQRLARRPGPTSSLFDSMPEKLHRLWPESGHFGPMLGQMWAISTDSGRNSACIPRICGQCSGRIRKQTPEHFVSQNTRCPGLSLGFHMGNCTTQTQKQSQACPYRFLEPRGQGTHSLFVQRQRAALVQGWSKQCNGRRGAP